MTLRAVVLNCGEVLQHTWVSWNTVLFHNKKGALNQSRLRSTALEVTHKQTYTIFCYKTLQEASESGKSNPLLILKFRSYSLARFPKWNWNNFFFVCKKTKLSSFRCRCCSSTASKIDRKKYSEFQRFRSLLASRLFLSQFWPLLTRASFLEAARAVAKIGSSLKSNHHCQI